MNSSDPLAPVPDGEAVQATLYCRPSTTTASAIYRYHRRLDDLRDRGIVDGIDVEEWATRVDLGGRAETPTARTYRRLLDWAEEAGVRLDPAFSVRTNESTFTGETTRYLVTPVACLTLATDELLAVYPHCNGGDVYTVEDGLALLSAEECGRGLEAVDGERIEAEE